MASGPKRPIQAEKRPDERAQRAKAAISREIRTRGELPEAPAKGGPSMDERLLIVEELMIAGVNRRVIQTQLHERWGTSERQIRKYIARVDELHVAALQQREQDAAGARALLWARWEDLYTRAVRDKDKRTQHAVLREMGRVLYDQKVVLTGAGGQPLIPPAPPLDPARLAALSGDQLAAAVTALKLLAAPASEQTAANLNGQASAVNGKAPA